MPHLHIKLTCKIFLKLIPLFLTEVAFIPPITKLLSCCINHLLQILNLQQLQPIYFFFELQNKLADCFQASMNIWIIGWQLF